MPDFPLPPLSNVQSILGSPARWSIVRELSAGTSLMVSELSQRTGLSPSATSKQMTILLASGIVINPRGRLYEIDPKFPIDPAARTVDFGHCLIRFNAGAPAPPASSA